MRKNPDLQRNIQIELALLNHVLIKDCLVLTRKDSSSKDVLVAYVVAEQKLSSEELMSFLGDQLLPDAFVFMTCLPFMEDGSIDYEALFNVAVVDPQALATMKQHLENLGELSEIELHSEYIKPEIEKTLRQKKEESYDFPTIETPKETIESNVPALVVGPSLDGHDYPLVLSYYLIKAAESHSYGIYFIKEDGREIFTPYSSLLQDAKKVLTGLKKLGLSPKDKLIIQLKDEQDFLTLFWSCILGGIVPLPIAPLNNNDPNCAQSTKIISAWKLLERPHIVSDDATKLLLKEVFSEHKECLVTVFSQLANNPAEEAFHSASPNDTALALMTSGSTGIPKIVMQTHRALTSRSYGSALMNDFTHKDIFLNWFPLEHVGGLVMFHIQALSVDANQIQVPISKIIDNPLTWLDLIEKYKTTVTWAPNFAYNLVNKSLKHLPRKKRDLSSMRFILNGGEEICAKQSTEFLENMVTYNLSKDCMFPSWGMSETCSGVAFSNTFYKNREVKKGPVEIGAPIPGIAFRIVGESGDILRENEIGILEVRGLPVTYGYYKNNEANTESFSADGWFKTGDKGTIQNGRLTITGRDKDTIIINGLNHTSGEIEAIIETIEGIKNSYTAAIGVRYESSTTDQLVIFFAPSSENYIEIENTIGNIRQKITQILNISPLHIIPLFPSDIPKTSIGKIQHSLLKQRLQEGKYLEEMRLFDPTSLLSSSSFITNWHRKNSSGRLSSKREEILILMDDFSLGEKLEARLKKEGYFCHKFEKRKRGDNQDLLKEIRTVIDDYSIKTIINLWDFDKEVPIQGSIDLVNNLQKEVCFSNLRVLQAFDKTTSVTRLINCSNFSQKVSETDQIVPAKSSVIGILKASSRENPHLCIQHLDFPFSDVDDAVESICIEVGNFSKDIEIAYRSKERFVRGLQAFHPTLSDKQRSSHIEKGGLYVITGGLGGIGLELSRFLLENYDANLLLIGRSELPDRRMWQQYLEDGLPIADKIKAFKHLQSIGKGKVIYISGDVCNREFIQKTLKETEDFYQSSIAGIFHLAGEFSESAVKDIDEQHLSDILDSKTLGAWNLYGYAKDQKHPMLFVSFSSSNGYLSGTNVGAYSAANTFLEALSTLKEKHIHHTCFSWSMWDELGMSKGYVAKEITKIKGYKILKPKEALDAMADALGQGVSSLIIGLDGDNLHIQPYLSAPAKNQKNVQVNYRTSAKNSSIATTFEIQSFYDRFNYKITPAFHDTAGAENVSVFDGGDYRSPLAEIWKDVLEMESVTYDDNFFDLGGHSLLMLRVQEKIKEKFLLNIEMVDLFKFPTINLLSQYLSSQHKSEKDIHKTLIDIWANILEFGDFTTEDTFFDLGGHSLLMIQVREQIKERLGTEIEMIDLFKYPTIKSLSEFMDKKSKISYNIEEPSNINSLKRTQRNYRHHNK